MSLDSRVRGNDVVRGDVVRGNDVRPAGMTAETTKKIPSIPSIHATPYLKLACYDKVRQNRRTP